MRQSDRSTGRWFWLLWLALCLFLALAVSGRANGLSSEDSSTGIAAKVSSLKSNLELLETLWKEQKIAYGEALRLSRELRTALNEARLSLASSRAYLSLSRLEVARLTRLLQQSEETLSRLSASFEAHRREARRVLIRSVVITAVAAFSAGAGIGILIE